MYGLSKGLGPLHTPPANRPVCVLLESDRELFGVLCNQVTLFEQTEPDITPLPKCMQTPGTPLRGLALDHGQILCVGSADSLLACLGDQFETAEASRPAQQPDEGLV